MEILEIPLVENSIKDTNELSVQELLQKQKKLLNNSKLKIAQAARLLLRDPQENVKNY